MIPRSNFDHHSVEEAYNYVKNLLPTDIEKALILGTGLGKIDTYFKVVTTIKYADIPNSPISTVQGHSGTMIHATANGENFLILAGRFHMYEGYTASQSTFMIHLLNRLGTKTLYITNAVGAVNAHYQEGDIVLVKDHINFFPDHPLRGRNDESFGPRFPDMSEVYSEPLRLQAKSSAEKLGLKIQEGIYFGWPGPSLETPAEYKMIHILGGDMVGMSTIPEVIVAKYYGMNILCISVVSNVCYPASRIKYTLIEDVIEVVERSAEGVMRVLVGM
jgi:purine-nucleoside phosphorylase